MEQEWTKTGKEIMLQSHPQEIGPISGSSISLLPKSHQRPAQAVEI